MEIFTSDEFTDDGRPPRSARLVASLVWSWSPAHYRASRYWICTDKSRSGWYLWEEGSDYDTGKACFSVAACGDPYKGIDAREAARQLMTAAWSREWGLYQTPGQGAEVREPGVLSEADVKKIEEDAYSDDDDLDTAEA